MSSPTFDTSAVRRWKRYPDYRPAGIHWLTAIPSQWQVLPLKRIASLGSGENITAESITPEGDYPVYGGNGLRGYATAFTHSGHHVLIGRQGALCGNINYATGRFWASEHAVVVSPRQPVAVLWLGETLRTMNLGQYAMSAAQPGLSVERIIQLSIPVPPPQEQRAIAAFVDRQTARIDALIGHKERLIALLEEKRQAVISHAVTRGLDPTVPQKDSGVPWLGMVPEHWNVSRTKFVARLESGHTPSRQCPEYWENCTIPWFTLADVWQLRDGWQEYISETVEKISELGIANSAARLLPAGTVVISRTASVGFSGIMALAMATSQDYVNWVCGPKIHPEYLLYVFRSMRQEFRRLVMGSTHQTIYMPDVNGFQTLVPPIEEQKQIVAYLRKVNDRVRLLLGSIRDAIACLHEYRTALISAAVTGQIDVRGEV